jgi:isoquinoline 1-oxidoreductase alpha subunit
MIAALTADVKNHRWLSPHRQLIIEIARAHHEPLNPFLQRSHMPTLSINGRPLTVDGSPDMPLLWALRDLLGMTGTKFGCGVGLCGACTVHVDGAPARSCITPLSALAGKKIVTIEAIGTTPSGKKIQQAWLDLEVVQCGYCQSGQIMSASALLAKNSRPSDQDIDDVMAGNICRCGTYVRIREAIKHAAKPGPQRKQA